MASLDATMGSMGLGPDLGTPMGGSGAGSVSAKITGQFHGVNSVIQNMISGLTKVSTLVGKIKKDMADIVKSARGGGGVFGSGGVGGLFGSGGVGSGASLGLGLSSVSGATSTGALTARLGSSGTMRESLGTFGGSKYFSGMAIASGVGGILGGAAKIGLGVAGATFAALPDSTDVLQRNRLMFNASLGSNMGPGALGSWATKNTMGLGVSQLDAFQGANTLSAYGYGAGTSYGAATLRQSAGLAYLTGQSVNTVAGTLGQNLTNPTMSNNLRMIGVSTTDRKGNPVGFNNLADQVYSKFGFSGLSAGQVNRELRPGMAGAANLDYYVQDPQMRAMMEQYIQLRAKNGGKAVDLGGSNLKGVLNSKGVGQGVLGAETSVRGLQSSEADKINAFAISMSKGISQGADAATKLNELMNGKAGLLASLAQLKGQLETFGGSKPGQGAIAGASLAASGFADILKSVGSVILGILGVKGGGSLLSKAGGALKGAGGALGSGGGGALLKATGIGTLVSALAYNVSDFNDVSNWSQDYAKNPDIKKLWSTDFLKGLVNPVAMGVGNAKGTWDRFFGGGSTAQGGGAGSGGVASSAGTGSNGNALVSYAEQFIGTKYTWGGTSPKGWDCSGFVQYVFKRVGVNLPRTSQQQYGVGTRVTYQEAQPGDLLFFHYRGGQSGANHVAIYIGGGKMLGAQNPRVGTGIHPVDKNNLIGVRRVLKGSVGKGAKSAAPANSNSLNSTGTNMLQSLGTTSLTVDSSGISASMSSITDLLNQSMSFGSSNHASTASTSGSNSAASSGATSGPTPSGSAQAYARNLLSKYGWGNDQWSSLVSLWNRESGWNANAINKSSGAYGIPQALPSAQGHPFQLGDYKGQIQWGLNYIQGRYGDPNKAWAHSKATGWYSQGSWNVSKDQLAHIHQGEMIIPASVAQSVRENVQQSMAGGGGNNSGSGVVINVYLQNASDAEATRFAQKVQSVLSGNATTASIGAN